MPRESTTERLRRDHSVPILRAAAGGRGRERIAVTRVGMPLAVIVGVALQALPCVPPSRAREAGQVQWRQAQYQQPQLQQQPQIQPRGFGQPLYVQPPYQPPLYQSPIYRAPQYEAPQYEQQLPQPQIRLPQYYHPGI